MMGARATVGIVVVVLAGCEGGSTSGRRSPLTDRHLYCAHVRSDSQDPVVWGIECALSDATNCTEFSAKVKARTGWDQVTSCAAVAEAFGVRAAAANKHPRMDPEWAFLVPTDAECECERPRQATCERVDDQGTVKTATLDDAPAATDFHCLKVPRSGVDARECGLKMCDCFVDQECFDQPSAYCFYMRMLPELGGGESYTCAPTRAECEAWRDNRRDDAESDCVEMRPNMMPTKP